MARLRSGAVFVMGPDVTELRPPPTPTAGGSRPAGAIMAVMRDDETTDDETTDEAGGPTATSSSHDCTTWAGESRGLLASLLDSPRDPHAWQGTVLSVHPEDGDDVDDLIDDVMASAVRRSTMLRRPRWSTRSAPGPPRCRPCWPTR